MQPHLPLSLAAIALVAGGPAQAQLCNGVSITKSPDGRALGHFPYGDAAPDALMAVPPSMAIGACRLRPEAAAALQRLLAAWQPVLQEVRRSPAGQGLVRWLVDVDPQSI